MKHGMLLVVRMTLAVLWPLLASAVVHASPTASGLQVSGEQQLLSLSGQLITLEDPGGTLQPQHLLGKELVGAWQGAGRQGLNRGPTRARWWLRGDLVNTDSQARERVILIHQPTLEDVRFYLACPDIPMQLQRTGNGIPFAGQQVRDHRPAVSFTLPARSRCTALFSVFSTGTLKFPATLADPDTYIELQQQDLLLRSLVLGMQMLLVVAGLVVIAARPHWLSVGYTALVSSQALLVITLSGLGYRFLWGSVPWLQVAMMPVSIALAWHCTAQFSLRILPRRSLIRMSTVPLWIAIGASWSAAIAQILMPDARIMSVLVASVALGVATLLAATLRALFTGKTTAFYAAAAMGIVLSAALVESASFLGLFSLGEYFLMPLQAGFLLQGLLLIGVLWQIEVVEAPRATPTVITEREVRRQVAERTRELSATVANLAAANHHLDKLSSTDALTGVYNRRYMDLCLKQASCDIRDARISFILFDIDHFKQVNDRYGHAVGDRCLREVTDCVRTQLRSPGDILCRYGGEEFAVILPDTDLDGATAVAEKIRQAVAENTIRLNSNELLRVTVSLGVTAAAMNGDISLMVENADHALYEAKRSGRNRWLASKSGHDLSQLRTSVNPNSSIH